MIAGLRQVDTNKETAQKAADYEGSACQVSNADGKTDPSEVWGAGGWRRIKSLLHNSSFSRCQSGAGDNMSVCGMTCAFVTLKVFLFFVFFLKRARRFFVRANNLQHKKHFGKLLIERETIKS